MATAPKQDPRTIVKISERLWSDEVGMAEASDVLPAQDPAYRWSNGNVFVQAPSYRDVEPEA